MRKLTKKISMLMVLAMLVGLFSGVVSASAASAWSFKSGKYNVAVGGEINMKKNEYADFDLLKDGKAPEGYTVVWKSSDEDVVWVNAKTGQLRADKAKKAEDGDKAVISATFTNTKTKKSATRSFTIVVGEVKAPVYTVEQADVTAVLGDAIKFAPVVKNEAGEVVKFATHKSYNGYFVDGKAITNPWTPEVAGEYTVTVAQFASKADVADLAKAVRKIDVKVTVKADLVAEATGLKEITVYGDFAKDAKFTVKKGNQSVSATATIAEDGKTATLALASKLRKGIYTVACGDNTASIDVVDEYVKKIVILENGSSITTGNNATEAYAHYDLLNQYDESVRKTYSVTWTSSTGRPVGVDATTGELTIRAASGSSFVYGNTVILTGVHTAAGNVVPVDATMTIGLENCVGSAEVMGVVRKGGNEFLSELPVDFADGQYYLAFKLLDRNGYEMAYSDADVKSLNFTCFSPLVLDGMVSPSETSLGDVVSNGVTVAGIQYGAIKLKPGVQAKQGGIADITITSNKTGVRVNYALRVNCAQTLAEFRIIAPDNIVAKNDGEITLSYEAVDTEGNPIKDFRALHQSLSFSSNLLRLVEKNDGTAELKYTVDPNASVSEDYDFPVLYTVIIPQSTGVASNVSFSIKNDRYTAGVAAYEGATNVLEGAELDVKIIKKESWENGLSYYDQYDAGRGWWQADLSNVYLAVKVSGKAGGLKVVGTTPVANQNKLEKYNSDYDYFTKGNYWSAGDLKLVAAPEVTTSQETFLVEFALAKQNGEIISGSEKTAVFNVVDLNQCTGFEAGVQNGLIKNDNSDAAKFSTTGLLANGTKVAIPRVVKAVSGTGNNVEIINKTIVVYDAWINAATGSATVLPVNGFWQQLAEDKLISNLSTAKDYTNRFSQFEDLSALGADGKYAGRKLTYYANASVYGLDGTFKDKVGASVEVAAYGVQSATFVPVESWEAPWITHATDAYVNATNGKITYEKLLSYIAKYIDNYGDENGKIDYAAKALAGDTLDAQISVNITKLTEGDKGLYANSLVLVANGTNKSNAIKTKNDKNEDIGKVIETNMITGAEIGDTFTVTYKHVDNGASHTINFVVGSDTNASFSYYTEELDWR